MIYSETGGSIKAELSVFFALITTVIAAMLLMTVESARVQGSRLYVTLAANSSIDSLFSQYHRQLWDEYRLLGLEHYAYDQLSDEMADFMRPYLEADNWYPIELNEIGISDMRLITDDDGKWYEKEVLDYMRYGIAASVLSLLEADNMTAGIKEGSSVDTLSDIYDGHSKEAVRLEEAIENIAGCLDSIKDHYSRADVCLNAENCRGFTAEAKQMQRELARIPALVEKYLRQAERMKAGLAESRRKLDAERDSGNIGEDAWAALDSDIREYESYVTEDGERHSEIKAYIRRAEADTELLDEVIAEAEEAAEYISDWEPEDEADELDTDALWAPVRSHFHQFDLISAGMKYGISDKETEKSLESIRTLLNGELLKLVLPDGASLGSEAYDMGEKPSESCRENDISLTAPVTDRLYLAEYAAGFMDYFGRGSYDADSRRTGSGRAELEYILFGRDNDVDNVQAAVRRLTEIRTGLNLIYLYKDNVRRNEARTLALSITGAAGLTPIATVVCFMIMSVWALGQAVCDIRDLLAGKRVPFIHSSDSFYLTLDGLLHVASGGISGAHGSNDKGLKYVDYLKMLIFFTQNTEQDYRCMDVMQMNMRIKQPDFLMNRLTYSLNAEISVRAGYIFTRLGLVKAQGQDTGGGYGMSVRTSYSY